LYDIEKGKDLPGDGGRGGPDEAEELLRDSLNLWPPVNPGGGGIDPIYSCDPSGTDTARKGGGGGGGTGRKIAVLDCRGLASLYMMTNH